MRISVILAMAMNRSIGIDNRLPWYLPEDLRHFRNLTMGHHILMGRKTFESIGKPLPGRISVVISRSADFVADGAIVVPSIGEAVASCVGDDEIFFIGGAEIFRQALERVDRIYLTEIQRDFPGDTFLPEFDRNSWCEASREKFIREDGLEYHFVVYEKTVR